MDEIRDSLPLLLTHKQLSDLTQTDEDTLYGIVARGRGPQRIRVGRQSRYPREGVITWLESRTIRA